MKHNIVEWKKFPKISQLSDAMRFGRSKLPELIIVTVFGIGGGFYIFQPAFKQYQIEHSGEPSKTSSDSK